jgi:hypothetical protein
MSKKIWIPLLAVAALLAACGRGEDANESGDVSVETVPDNPAENPAASGDQETTPGGTAGETAATPPGTEPDTATPPPSQSPGE